MSQYSAMSVLFIILFRTTDNRQADVSETN
jgi:hypothetical protein